MVKGVNINVYVYVDHAIDQLTRWIHTGILIFFNLAPVIWNSKLQATIKSSTFGYESVALRTIL